jgi:hypothetical protein
MNLTLSALSGLGGKDSGELATDEQQTHGCFLGNGCK